MRGLMAVQMDGSWINNPVNSAKVPSHRNCSSNSTVPVKDDWYGSQDTADSRLFDSSRLTAQDALSVKMTVEQTVDQDPAITDRRNDRATEERSTGQHTKKSVKHPETGGVTAIQITISEDEVREIVKAGEVTIRSVFMTPW